MRLVGEAEVSCEIPVAHCARGSEAFFAEVRVGQIAFSDAGSGSTS